MNATFGSLLRRLREEHHLSQLTLSTQADVSPKHLSFLENGRAMPSREMVLRLGAVLALPLRAQNALLEAAGFASCFRESSFNAPEMAELRNAVTLILRQAEPFGAIAVDRFWNIVVANRAYAMIHSVLAGNDDLAPYEIYERPKVNALREILDPKRMKPHIENWEEVALGIVPTLLRAASSNDLPLRSLAKELLAYPGVPAVQGSVPRAPLVLPVRLRVGPMVLSFFTTITTVGTPQDVTAQELSIEQFHPMDAETERLTRELLGSLDGQTTSH